MLRLVNVEIYEDLSIFNILSHPKQSKIVDSSIIVSSTTKFIDIFKKVMEDKIYDLHNDYIPEDFPLKFNMITKFLDDIFPDEDSLSIWDQPNISIHSSYEIDKDDNIRLISREFLQ